jgi:polyhydroxyalkanoate synthesis regulator phasin
MEKITLLNSQSFEIEAIGLQGESLDIVFGNVSISELEDSFSNKNIISTIKVQTEAGEEVAIYSGYTKCTSIEKDMETSLISVKLKKVDETQARIDELEKQVQALTETVSKLKK